MTTNRGGRKYIKLRNLPTDLILDGRHFKGNKKMKIKSGWNRGFWLQEEGSQRIYPMFFNSFKDIKDKMISLFPYEQPNSTEAVYG